jgi:RHS repeat-associated protein
MGCLKLSYYPESSPLKVVKDFSFSVEKTGAGVYRYGYQGQFSEADPETKLNSFELRMYDPVIGRWICPDPMREHWSPYMAMGNNPAMQTDPTGGCDECPKDASDGTTYNHADLGTLTYSAKDNTWSSAEFGVIHNSITVGPKVESNYMAGAAVISAGLLIDDASVVGVVDDLAIPFLFGGAYLLDKADKGNESYPGPWTYTVPDPTVKLPAEYDSNEPPDGSGWGKPVKWLFGALILIDEINNYRNSLNNKSAQEQPRKDNQPILKPGR